MARYAGRYLHGKSTTRNNYLNGQNQRKINNRQDDAIINNILLKYLQLHI